MIVENIFFKIAYILASYLLGSVVFAYVMAKIYKFEGMGKVDRPGTAGSGRQIGYKASIPVFLFDVGKGALVILVARWIGLDQVTMVVAALAVLAGHNWPVFYKFRGGGGLATAMGIGVALVPLEFAITMAISLSIVFIYKYTLGKKHKVNPNVIGGLIGATIFPLIVAFIPPRRDLPIILLFCGIFLIIVVKGIILHLKYRKVPTAN